MINSIFALGETSFNPQPTARNLTKPARMLRLGSSRLGARPCNLVFRRMGEASFASQTTAEQGESLDTLSISARDLLPLRLCTFAPLRSFAFLSSNSRDHFARSTTQTAGGETLFNLQSTARNLTKPAKILSEEPSSLGALIFVRLM